MTIEVSAKKIDDAINQGLKQLGVTLDEVNVEVVDAGGLFRKAKVRLTLEGEEKEQSSSAPAEANNKISEERKKADDGAIEKQSADAVKQSDKSAKQQKSENNDTAAERKQAVGHKSGEQNRSAAEKPKKAEKPNSEKPTRSTDDRQSEKADNKEPRKKSAEDKKAADKALGFVKELVNKMGFTDAVVEADESGESINITAPSGDDSLIIGRHGETLSAIGYLAETGARADKCHINITVDCNGYRDRRAATLTEMAKRRANECVAKHRRIKLDPMERIDRRTIHFALTDDERVVTASEGKEPHRYIVIMPKDLVSRDRANKPQVNND